MAGKRRDNAYWRCQACGARFSGWRQSALDQLKTPLAGVSEVLTALAEGVDVAAARRIFGHHPTTEQRWLQREVAHVQQDGSDTRMKCAPVSG